jgi:hypothetical protein
MPALKAAPVAPQLHSPDGRVRLRPAALSTILFEHVCTVQDLAVLDDARPEHRGAASAGITEWCGAWSGRLISLGWDWVCLDDGALVAQTTVPPRSNLMLLDSLGYDADPVQADASLWCLIHGLPWQRIAACNAGLAAQV